MKERTEYLSSLNIGASACYVNAERLIRDAECLFYDNHYLSSYFLSELSLEEIAKGYTLLRWISRRKKITRKDWETLKIGARAHVNKLKIAREADDKWLREVTKNLELDYNKIQKGMLSQFTPNARNIDEFRTARAKDFYELRMKSIYVDFDFEKKEWLDPASLGISSDGTFSLQRMMYAKHMLSVLGTHLRGKLRNRL